MCSFRILVVVPFLCTSAALAQEESPSFSKQIRPFLAKYCVECHNKDDADGGFVAESIEQLFEGGNGGEVLVAGKPDESRLVLQLEGKAKPKMPPKSARQPRPAEIARVRAWVAAGAKADSTEVATPALPPIEPRKEVPPKVTALEFTPQGKLVAAAYREVFLFNPADGTYFGKWTPASDAAEFVTALTLSSDGKQLAVATGRPGQAGSVHLYTMPKSIVPADIKPERTLAAHADIIYAVAFSPDGKLIATSSYDRVVKLWNVQTGEEAGKLTDHSDAVYGVAFSPNAKLLASVAADRAVKLWDVASGRRLYTLSDPTDWLYAVAWSPDGRYLAAAGVDKSIRVWRAAESGAELIHSTFAHDGPITRLVYSADSKTLFSLSEDRTVKAWDAERMVERSQTAALEPNETLLALAASRDGQLVAVGRFDGRIRLIEQQTGKDVGQPIVVAAAKPAPKPESPVLSAIHPRGGQRGQSLQLVFEGKHLSSEAELVISGSAAGSIRATSSEHEASTDRVTAKLEIAPDAKPGVVRVGLQLPHGKTAELPFAITAFPEVAESAANDSQSMAQKITLPASLVGSIEQAGDTDYFRFEAAAGQQLGVELLGSVLGSKLEPVLTLLDETGRVLAEPAGSLLGHTFDQAGTYVLRIHDVEFRGSGEMFYRANLGDVPIVTDVFPLGIARGSNQAVEVRGVNLAGVDKVSVSANADAEPGTRLDVPVKLPSATPSGYADVLNAKNVVVGEYPELVEAASNDEPAAAMPMPTPSVVNGRIEQPGDSDFYRFSAKKGERLIVDVNARRLGSPLDSFVEILDASGQPLARATLRCLAQTYTVFRDHDSNSAGIRIESWNELAVNDYVMVGNQLLRILALPRNPDDDAQFFQFRGARLGYLGTTPAHVSVGTPVYKVATHPPGAQFPPNGMPLFTIYHENDDGGPLYSKDSGLFFDPPADGEYLVRITDVRGKGGMGYAYRLAVRPPKPSFNVSFSPTSPAIWKGGALPIAISCERIDGFESAIEVRLENLPPGFSAPVTTIPPNEFATSLALAAEENAATPDKDAPKLKLIAKAMIDGKEQVREIVGGLPNAVEPGDIVATLEQSEVKIQPGRQAKLTVKIERRNGFKGRIPIEVRGLPHGTRVLDVGLNGILITEQETSRTFTLYCEPWAEATTHPFVVLAKREGKNTEHAARSVLLRVERPAAVAASE